MHKLDVAPDVEQGDRLINPGLQTHIAPAETATVEPLKNRLKQFAGPALSILSLALGPIGTQYFYADDAMAMGFRAMALGMIVTSTPFSEPMFAKDTQNLGQDADAPGNIRHTFWTNTLLLGLIPSVIGIPILLNAVKILGAGGLGDSDIAAYHAALPCDLVDLPIQTMLSNYLTLCYQANRVDSASIMIISIEFLSLGLSYALKEMGLEGLAIANLIADLIGICMLAYYEKKSPPAGQSIFNFSTECSETFKQKAKILFEKGGLTWFAELVNQWIGTYTNVRFASVGLQGMLAVLSSACSQITNVLSDIMSRHIAISTGNERIQKIKKMFLWGAVAPYMILTPLAIGLARPLSNLLGGAEGEHQSILELNNAAYVSSSWLGAAFTIAYLSLMDCNLTNIPALIYLLASGLTAGACFALEPVLTGDASSMNANIGGAIATGIASLLLFAYTWKKWDVIVGHEATQEEAIALPKKGCCFSFNFKPTLTVTAPTVTNEYEMIPNE